MTDYNKRREQHAPVPAVETLDGEIKTFTDDEAAMRYASKHGAKKCGQLFKGLDEIIE